MLLLKMAWFNTSQAIRDQYLKVENANIYPFVSFIETEKAGYMIRQYFANNLSDRLRFHVSLRLSNMP